MSHLTDSEHKYLAFLSYSHEDNREQRPGSPDGSRLGWGDWLLDALKTFSIPVEFAGQINSRGEIIPERIDTIFREEQGLPDDVNLSEDIRKALEQSTCLIVICSPRSAASARVNETVRYFKQLGRGRHILPIVIAGEPNASEGKKPDVSPEDECFVPALRHPVQADGTLDTTRRAGKCIFVDARHGVEKREILAGDNRNAEADLEMAKIQLIALVIGVGFNGLWWREQKRHFFDLAEAQRQAREALSQVAEVQRQIREAQDKALELQNLPRDVHGQIQEAQTQAREAQKQLQEFQDKLRETQTRLEETSQRALAAESKVLEAQQQAQEARSQLVETQNQVREAQSKVLETQNLNQGVSSQIQEVQQQAVEAQNQAQKQTLEAQKQLEELQNKVRETQTQLEEAGKRAQAAEGKVLETQQQAREAQNKYLEAQSQVQEFQNQARLAQSQLEEARKQVSEAEAKVLEIQNRTKDVQGQITGAENQVRTARAEVRELQKKSRSAQRLAKVLAVLAVLGALAASIAWWQRVVATQALAKSEATQIAESTALSREQIQQALQKINGAGQGAEPALNELAVRIPASEISNTLAAAAVILDEPQRGVFQGQLMAGWARTNAPAAFDWGCQLTNVDFRGFALETIVPAMVADTPTNTLARLNDLKPLPGGSVYAGLFQRWAVKDPIQAIELRQLVPGQDADTRILSAIMTVWGEQQPEAALKWLESQPDSEALPAKAWRNTMMARMFDTWAAKDLEAATKACEQLPEGAAKTKAWEYVLSQRIEKDPASAAAYVTNLPAGEYRQGAIEALCNRWDDTNVLAWAQSLPAGAERVGAINGAMVNWARKDPQAAGQYTNVDAELSGATMDFIARTWFRRDVTATTNWVASLPNGGKKELALIALMEPWAQNNPKGMFAFGLGLPAGVMQTRYLAVACSQLAVRDVPGAVELLQPLADAALRQSILEQAIQNCDTPQIDAAAKYIAAMPAGDDQKAAIKGLVSSWTQADREAAANWLVAFPETNAQPEQVQSVVKAWAQAEPAAVAKWLANLPAGTNSEGTIGAFLEGAVVKYPEFAGQWTESVTDEAKRQQYRIQVARQWMKADASAAAKWIDGLNLSEADRRALKSQGP